MEAELKSLKAPEKKEKVEEGKSAVDEEKDAMKAYIVNDMMAKTLPKLNKEQKEMVEKAIAGKGIKETQSLLDAFKSVIPVGKAVGGVPVPSGIEERKSIFASEGSGHAYKQDSNGKWQYT